MLIAFGFFVTTNGYGGPWPFIIAFISVGALHLWFNRWPCPRCGKPYTEPKRDLTYSEQCQHCGLGLWKDPEDVADYRERQR
jgi:endogenous inhibitor of DNA gyrase (YacG/DUF329 family)